MKSYLLACGICTVGMVFAATQWLPALIGVPIGSGSFVVLMLCVATAILRSASASKKSARGFFISGLFLLVVAFPISKPVQSLFEPAMRSAYGEIPAEIVFGVLAMVCIVKAWLLWASDEKNA